MVRLSNVNEGLLQRVREVELAYRGLREEIELEKEQEYKKLKGVLYEEIEEYLKGIVERMANELKI